VPAGQDARAAVLSVLRVVLGEPRVHAWGRALRRRRIDRGQRVVRFRGVTIELDPTSANSESVLAGRFERPLLDFVLPRLAPGDQCLDVGAHVGYWTVPVAAAVGATGRVMAVEAYRPNVERLSANLARNGLTNTEIVHAAAAAEAGSARLRVSGTSSSWNSIVSGGSYFNDETAVVEVPAVALDDLDLPGPLALVKVDVEGAEELVVAGASAVLARARILVMEVGGARVTSEEYVRSVSEMLFSFDEVYAVNKRAGALTAVPSADELRRRWTDVADVTKVVACRTLR
jgi:FkbM family methyltransferase